MCRIAQSSASVMPSFFAYFYPSILLPAVLFLRERTMRARAVSAEQAEARHEVREEARALRELVRRHSPVVRALLAGDQATHRGALEATLAELAAAGRELLQMMSAAGLQAVR